MLLFRHARKVLQGGPIPSVLCAVPCRCIPHRQPLVARRKTECAQPIHSRRLGHCTIAVQLTYIWFRRLGHMVSNSSNGDFEGPGFNAPGFDVEHTNGELRVLEVVLGHRVSRTKAQHAGITGRPPLGAHHRDAQSMNAVIAKECYSLQWNCVHMLHALVGVARRW